MKSNGYSEGGTISLLSCNTGKGTNSFAKRLAKIAKATVYAPISYYCYVHSRWSSNYTGDVNCKKDNIGLKEYTQY
jgi:hypothetical protein